jgi:hypothetical protein
VRMMLTATPTVTLISKVITFDLDIRSPAISFRMLCFLNS